MFNMTYSINLCSNVQNDYIAAPLLLGLELDVMTVDSHVTRTERLYVKADSTFHYCELVSFSKT